MEAQESGILITVSLRRHIGYHLISTFLPSICVLILAQTTVYFKSEHFKTSIPLAVTSMLVMYTLNNSIASSLPKTSYIKLIDIWLLFGLILPFFITILLVIMEHMPKNHVFQVNEKNGKLSTTSSLGSVENIRKFAQVHLPLVEATFIVVFFLVAFSLH